MELDTSRARTRWPAPLAALGLLALLQGTPAQAQRWFGADPMYTFSSVGIGTSAPGTARLGVVAPAGRHGITASILDPGHWAGIFTNLQNNTSVMLGGGSSGSLSALEVRLGSATALRVTSGGNVGIGTSNPGAYKLAVNGSLRAKEIKVDLGWGADFVFDEQYRLRPLEEVASFVAAHRHLPEIPPAAELTASGVDLGEMQMKLLQKVEELTLYSIQLKRENEALRKELAARDRQLEERLALLERQLAREARAEGPTPPGRP